MINYDKILKLFDDEKQKTGATHSVIAKRVFKHKSEFAAVSLYSRIKKCSIGYLKSKELEAISKYFNVDISELTKSDEEIDQTIHADKKPNELDIHIDAMVLDLRYVIKYGDYVTIRNLSNAIRSLKESIVNDKFLLNKTDIQ